MHFWLNCEIGNSDDFGYYYKVENSEKPDVVGDFFDTASKVPSEKDKIENLNFNSIGNVCMTRTWKCNDIIQFSGHIW